MATMQKEKREKKKKPKSTIEEELGSPPSVSDLITILQNEDNIVNVPDNQEYPQKKKSVASPEEKDHVNTIENNSVASLQETNINQTTEVDLNKNKDLKIINTHTEPDLHIQIEEYKTIYPILQEINEHDNQTETNVSNKEINEETEIGIEINEQLKAEENEIAMPTAPIFEETAIHFNKIIEGEAVMEKVTVKHICMSLEKAESLFCGAEIDNVKALSAREAIAVDNSIMITPDHPLVDLLSTFKHSLKQVERERTQLSHSYVEEHKFRNNLWQVEKTKAYASEHCNCGQTVTVQQPYEKATLLLSRFPVARMRLKAIARDVQESYVHHVHSALQAHCQIEEYIYRTLHTTNSQVRTALSLVLEALRTSESTPSVIAEALQRWASGLVAGLLKYGHLADLLFVWHHLFRQNRSVSWSARIMCVSVREMLEVARTVALLEILMTSRTPHLDVAAECTEDDFQVWEEVDRNGSGSAVSSNAMRERDILSILNAIPFREIVARLALIRHQNITDATDYEWGDGSGGRGVMKAICGTRVLLATLYRGVMSLTHYKKVKERVEQLAVQCLNALADLHEQCRSTYAPELIDSISTELEAAFSMGWTLMLSTNLSMDSLPFSLLTAESARAYVSAVIQSLHGDDSKAIEGQDVGIPAGLECTYKLKILSQVAISRTNDYEIAKYILHFLVQEAFSTKSPVCSQKCQPTSRLVLSKILLAHKYLYAETICTFVGFRIGDEIKPSDLEYLSLVEWVPVPHEVTMVVWHVARNNPTLLPSILLALDYYPISGLPFESQHSIAVFLCDWLKELPQGSPEWAWDVLRLLKLHRLEWGCLDAPTPNEVSDDLFTKMFTLLSTAWGHCVPLICEYGVEVLLSLIRGGRVREALHCLSYVTRVMADSPESITFTPQFSEFCNGIMEAGPTLVQRAFRRGGDTGSNLMITLLIQQLHTKRRQEDNILQLFSSWVHLCSGHPSSVEAALVSCYDCTDLDQHLTMVLQDEAVLTKLSISTANISPTLAVHCLGALHTQRELRGGVWLRLLDVLDSQRMKGAKIHVDNALQSIGVNFRSDDLVIHKVAGAVLVAPLHHPAHLLLWRLFFYLYLQKPSNNVLPAGPLFFDGIIKSRTLTHLKKKLQDGLAYHTSEVNQLSPPKNPDTIEVNTPVELSEKEKDKFELLPGLTLVDLTGEGDETSQSSDEDDDDKASGSDDDKTDTTKVVIDHALIKDYHKCAARACRKYLLWLEAGDKTDAQPYNAEISHFITSQALNAAWKLQLKTMIPTNVREDTMEPKRKVSPLIKTPLQRLLDRLHKYRTRHHRSHRPLILRLLIKNLPSDQRTLITLMEKLLKRLVGYAKSWQELSTTITQLDTSLWDLVKALRVSTPLKPVQRSCYKNCSPITLVLPGEEWSISPAVERSITDNRRHALCALRNIARPNADLAKLTAGLHTFARCVTDVDIAVSVTEMAVSYGSDCLEQCPPARDALTSLVTNLAQRHISVDGVRCEQLANRWYSKKLTNLQQTLTCIVISPRTLSPTEITLVYRAVLNAQHLPPHVVFSQLSKFEISKWSEKAEIKQKDELLDSILDKLNSFGPSPSENCHILVEMLCVHMSYLLDARVLCHVICKCARASVSATLPASVWEYIYKAAERNLLKITPEEICLKLRELGVIWWEARMSNRKILKNQTVYRLYVMRYCSLLHVMLRVLLHALKANPHNTPEHVIWLSWSCVSESWSPWLLSDAVATPLLASTDDREDILKILIQCLNDLYSMVPGGEKRLLQEIFNWCSMTVGTSGLLPHISTLPWHQTQWFCSDSLNAAVRLCSSGEEERVFLRDVTRYLKGEAWVCGVSEQAISPHLAALLYLFTKADLHKETLDEIVRLPWHRLPLMALEPEFQRFFVDNHSNTVPYHDLPQFRVLVCASEMHCPSARETAQEKRLSLLSHWIRAITARTDNVYKSSMAAILELIDSYCNSLNVNEERSEKELTELVSRAMTILCTEPAAAAVINVWQSWVSYASPTLSVPCVRAISTLTNPNYFEELAEYVLKAYFKIPSSAWQNIHVYWKGSFWRESALISRGCLLSSYALTSLPTYELGELLRIALLTLSSANIHYINQEPEIALWICFIARVIKQDASEVSEVGIRVLTSWAEDPKLSILRTITMSKQVDKPTPKLRLLARLALCIIQSSEAAIKAYETTHMSIFGANPTENYLSWGRTQDHKLLPKLAIKLFPSNDQIFRYEFELASGS